MKKIIKITLILFAIFSLQFIQAKKEKRTVLALIDLSVHKIPLFSNIHKYLNMAIEHNGLKVEYFDISKNELPKISKDDDIRGIVTWFVKETTMPPQKYLSWVHSSIDMGKKFLVVGRRAPYKIPLKEPGLINREQDFLKKIGVKDLNFWVGDTSSKKFDNINDKVLNYEAKVEGKIPSYSAYTALEGAKSYLSIVDKDKNIVGPKKSDMVIFNSNGNGYINEAFTIKFNQKNFKKNIIYFNPFEVSKLAFKTSHLPKPDTTTLAGKRIYYSHVDGDGLRNSAQFEYKGKKFQDSMYIYIEEFIKKFPDLPVTFAPIIGDVDSSWYGTPKYFDYLKQILAFKHVEPATHTYSHPYDWGFFDNYHPQDELQYLSNFTKNYSRTPAQAITFDPKTVKKDSSRKIKKTPYAAPRAFAVEHFTIKKETKGSVDFFKKHFPEKKLELIQWSGNCVPYKDAIKTSYANGLMNINGGDPRKDKEHPSIGWVSPIGLKHKDAGYQIYTSGSNELIYDIGWNKKNGFGKFSKVIETFKNTESPIRIKPINVYYHVYSCDEKDAYDALKTIMEYVNKEDKISIFTTEYVKIALGFFNTEFEQKEENIWEIQNRGALQTVRFENKNKNSIDYKKSKGVVGHKDFQGSLYVYLDKKVDTVTIALKKEDGSVDRAYLKDSNWVIYDTQFAQNKGWSFKTSGWGPGKQSWRALNGNYSLQVKNKNGENIRSSDIQVTQNKLNIELKRQNNDELTITLLPIKKAKIMKTSSRN